MKEYLNVCLIITIRRKPLSNTSELGTEVTCVCLFVFAVIKTGESGLTVFRLLSKTGGWVWVKANAKLIYKGGRPEFIISYQRAIS